MPGGAHRHGVRPAHAGSPQDVRVHRHPGPGRQVQADSGMRGVLQHRGGGHAARRLVQVHAVHRRVHPEEDLGRNRHQPALLGEDQHVHHRRLSAPQGRSWQEVQRSPRAREAGAVGRSYPNQQQEQV